MTTLALSQIPSNINTVEKLHAWSGFVLRSVHGQTSLIEVSGLLPEARHQAPVIEPPGGTICYVFRNNIEFDPTHVADKTKKLWEFARETNQNTIPAFFTTN
jgi:hypothetical protein